MHSNSDFLAAPIRFVWHMFLWGIFLLASPFLLIVVLVFGIRFMSADEIWLTKILLVILGPFALVLWWIVVRRVTNHCRAKCLIARKSRTGDDYTDGELRFLEQVGKPRHIRNFVVLTVSLAGSIYCAMLFQTTSDVQFFIAVLAGIFSPAIIVAAYKALFGF
jgi:energy-coupling factor transporter transmembrane protein EcfT